MNPLIHLRNAPDERLTAPCGFPAKRDFGVYKEVVEKYSRRQLSFPSDILNAAAGFLATMDECLGSENVFGLPGQYLDLALLWNPAEPSDRRKVGHHEQSEAIDTYVFPSWSWAGWTGSIQHVVVETGLQSHDHEGHEYAQSEIGFFRIAHRGTLCEMYKDDEDMKKKITRYFGEMNGKPSQRTYSQYVRYTRRNVSNFHSPDLGPGVLQFWTHTVGEPNFSVDLEGDCYLPDYEHATFPWKQKVGRMLDAKKPHCGLGFFPGLGAASSPAKGSSGTTYEWALISIFGDADSRRPPFQKTD
jgi:hypothetical protein